MAWLGRPRMSHRVSHGVDRPEISAFELGIVVLTAMALLLPGMWLYTLVDPWEGHYAEVARRILEERDWVFLRWQDEPFQSKPALSPWLIAATLKLLGIAEHGGYSGELASSPLVIFAVRLPFVLFGVFGLVITWYAVARLAGRRVAWLSLLVLGTTPFYGMIARQAITDMPMVGCLIGAVACFALAADGSATTPITPLWRRLAPHHLFLGAFALIVGGQALYYALYFVQHPGLGHGVRVPVPGLVLAVPMIAAVVLVSVWCLWLQPVRTRRHLLMLWFYVLIGVSILAKGPPAVAVAGGTCLLYLIVTGRWRLLREVEIPRGILVVAAIALPWHFAMFFKAGMGYYQEYVHYHLLGRAFEGVHGDRATFAYHAQQLGIGMWPWSALVPAAVAGVFAGRLQGSAGHLRTVISLWAVFAVAMFCLVQTKFHHYIFPAVPALAILVAFCLEDILVGRVRRPALVFATGIFVLLLIARDLVSHQNQLIDLYTYRPGRPWPSEPPWSVDVGPRIYRFAGLFALALGALAVARFRRQVVAGLVVCGVIWASWAMNGYMQAAAPHWGQGQLHQTYYRERSIHGVEIHYGGLHELAEDWAEAAGDYKVKTALPASIRPGKSALVRLYLPGRSDAIKLDGWISQLDSDAFWIRIPKGERQKIAELIERGRNAPPSRRRPDVQVDADRLIAWMLNWRSENFWSSGEIWGRTPETRTVFDNKKGRDNAAFQEYLEEYGREGQTYFVITQASSVGRLDSILPTQRAKETLEVRDNSCNKFTLLSFTL